MNEQLETKCRFCHYLFKPEPMVNGQGKQRVVYVECPRCGNGIERNYSAKKAKELRGKARGKHVD